MYHLKKKQSLLEAAPENYMFMPTVRQGRQGGEVACIYYSEFTFGEKSFMYVAINLLVILYY